MKCLEKCILNSLIVFYLSIIYFSGVPESNTLNSRLKAKSLNIAFILGIWPSWSMFAPNPIKFDSKSFVKLTYQNGEIKEFDVEEEPIGLLAPFRKARWMKYSQDNLRNPKQKGLLNPAIRYFYRKYKNPQNAIVSVQIKRKWREVYPFSDKKLFSIKSTPRNIKKEILITQKFVR